MSTDFERMLTQMLVPPDNGAGRSIDDLLKTDDILSGRESQRLRTFFTSNCMEPMRDLDDYGWAVVRGELDVLKQAYIVDCAKFRQTANNEETARRRVTDEIYNKRWGPTRVPIFNLILLATILNSKGRPQQLQVARWLIDEVKVPVDARDLSGSTALHHAITTKPSFDPEYAQILYDAGANVNNRNRYGGTSAHESTMVWDMGNREAVQQATDALKWFLEHGGNMDIKDSDGVTARRNVDTSRNAARKGIHLGTWEVMDDEDKRRVRLVGKVCAFCGRNARGDVTLKVCAGCKTAVYCSSGSPSLCQKGDWPHHKKRCKKVSA